MKRSICRTTAWLVSFSLLVVTWAPTASAETDFLTDLLMSEAQERQLAEQEHPKVLEQFGGQYDAPELQAYLGSIARFLGQASRRPDIEYRLTILNTPIVNAFALPAGYLYVSRGLLALADSEAEVAGVIAHEIGHVTARHTAERYRNSILAQGLVGILGAAVENTDLSGLGRLVEPGAVMFLQGFSREHEHEADLLAVETMSRAGYDPRAMASFLAKLRAQTALDDRLSGQPDSGDQFNLFATHPRTVDRVERTIEAAGGVRVRDPMLERQLYLRKIDGLLYGDDPEQGVVRGAVFMHPKLNVRFEVPSGFSLLNGQHEVVARHPRGSVIKYDRRSLNATRSVESYLSGVWAGDAELQAVRSLSVNGRPAATGEMRVDRNGQPFALRLLAIEASSSKVDRFTFAAPASPENRIADDFEQTVSSYRNLTDWEVRDATAFRLVPYRVRAGDTVAGLSVTLPFMEMAQERLRVLNGLGPDDEPVAGTLIKLVKARRQ